MSDKRHRTLVLIEILGEEPWEGDIAEDLAEDITNGHFSAEALMQTSEEISIPLAAQLLIAQGSDPTFLNICRTCQEESTNDGEGYDDECGNCADRREAVRQVYEDAEEARAREEG